ncbi:hypothetical protein GCM10023340_43780 [Nocardioides marinquilinus]|uniref:Bacterial bifunctional deaminase-reductase C-terminal domain-containing protein n=1 Tax=Nocardioides marinquilinus TaxID=1210400 RepID=A0ABP9QAA9_9ACTN
MGDIVISLAISADGYASGPGDDLSVMPFDRAFNLHNAALVGRAAALLLGAITFRQMLGYWPHQRDAADPSERAIAQRYADGLPVSVVSDSLGPDDTGVWRDQTTVVPRDDVRTEVERLRGLDGDVVVFGSTTLVRHLLREGLADVVHLLVGAGLVAGDRPALADTAATALRLQDVRRFDGADSVLLSYAVVPA